MKRGDYTMEITETRWNRNPVSSTVKMLVSVQVARQSNEFYTCILLASSKSAKIELNDTHMLDSIVTKGIVGF